MRLILLRDPLSGFRIPAEQAETRRDHGLAVGVAMISGSARDTRGLPAMRYESVLGTRFWEKP